VVLTGSGRITFASSRNITTNGGDIVFWANASGGTFGGITIGDSVTLDSRTATDRASSITSAATGGGRIWLGGGATVNTEGLPTGASVGTGLSIIGVTLGSLSSGATTTALYSGGGDIYIRGTSAAAGAGGVYWNRIGIANAGIGTVTIIGDAINASGTHGIELGAFSGSMQIVAGGGSASSPAVLIEGSTLRGDFTGLQTPSGFIQATGAGGITINTVSPSNGSGWSNNMALDLLASIGAITVNATGGIGFRYLGTIGQKAGTLVEASSSNIQLISNRFTVNSSIAVNSFGSLTIEPVGNDFSTAFSTTGWTLGSNFSSLTIGKSATSADGTNDVGVTIASAINVKGPINIFGGGIALNGNIISTATTGNGINVKGQSITQAAGVNVTTSGASISYVASGGLTTASMDRAIAIGDFSSASRSTINAAGGNITISGSFGAGGVAGTGDPTVAIFSTDIKTSGDGAISITGDATNNPNTAGDHWTYGMNLGNLLIQTERGDITLTGTGSKTSANSRGVVIHNYGAKILSYSGNISIKDQQPVGSTGTYTGLYFQPSNAAHIVIGSDGSTLLSGTSTASSSNITFHADKLAFPANGGFGTRLNTTGSVVIESVGSTFTSGVDTASLVVGHGPSELRIGKSSNTANITISNAQTVAGPISVYGGAVTIASSLNAAGSISAVATTSILVLNQSDLQATNPGASILLKAGLTAGNGGANNGLIYLSGSTDLTTNGGNIVLWSNAFNVTTGTANNEIIFDSNNNLTSNGGKIVIAGGLDDGSNGGVANDGLPDGYAYRGGYVGSAIDIRSNVKLRSGGGDVIIRGHSNPSGVAGTFNGNLRGYGVQAGSGFLLDSGLGTIDIKGLSNSDHAVWLDNGNFAITSASTAAHAISIYGQSTINFVGFGAGFNAGSGQQLIQATGAGGGIKITAISSVASANAIWLGNNDANSALQILSASGDIEFETNGVFYVANQKLYLGNRRDSTAIQGIVPVANTASGDITLKAAAFSFANTHEIHANSTGQLSILPYADDFSSAFTLSTPWVLSNQLSGLVIGNSNKSSDGTADQNITIGSAQTVSGPISVYGGNITVNANLNTTVGGASGDVLLKASGAISLAANQSITTTGGDVTFWADADASNGGAISLLSASSIQTAGGHIVLAGGNAISGEPGGYARGVGVAGVSTTGSFTLNSGGGNISIKGSSNLKDGVLLSASGTGSISSAGGLIEILGVVDTAAVQSGDTQTGVRTTGGGTVSINSGLGAVNIEGSAPRNGLGFGISESISADATTTLIQSANTTASAITIKGTGGHGISFRGTATRIHATGQNGGITLNGISSTWSTTLYSPLDVLAVSGSIQWLNSDSTDGFYAESTTITLGSKAGVTGLTSSQSDVTLQLKKIFGSPTFAIGTTGDVAIQGVGGTASFGQAFNSSQFGLNANNQTMGAFTFGSVGNTQNLTINQALTATGNVTLHGAGLAINSAITASGNNVNLHATGNVTQSAAITAAGLGLHGTGNFTLTNTGNNITTLAGGSSTTKLGNVDVVNNGVLTIGTVNPTGITSTGTVRVETLTGDLTLAANISTTSTSADAVILNAGKNTAAGTSTGGNILISGSPTITMGTGGIAKLYTGSVSGSTGLTALVGSGTGRFRYNTAHDNHGYTLDLDTGINALYRERPSLTGTIHNASVTYGESLPTFTLSNSGGIVNGDSDSGLVVIGANLAANLSGAGLLKVKDGGYSVEASGLLALGYDVSSITNGTLTVTVKALDMSGLTANNKIYDGNTTATLSGTAALTNGATTSADGKFVTNDVVSLTGTAAGTFADANVADGINVAVSGLSLTGADAGNYTLNGLNLFANITPALLTVTANNQTRVYGDANPTLSQTITGFVNNETATGVITGSAVASTLATATSNVGSYSITASAAGLSAANYTFMTVDGALTIDPKAVTLFAPTVTKTYDGTNTYSVTADDLLAITNSGVLANGETITAATITFDNRNVGAANKTVTLDGVTVSSANSNYTFTLNGNDVSTINQLASATWVGGSGNWTDASNWAVTGNLGVTGALPDGGNVALAVIPTGFTGTVTANTDHGHTGKIEIQAGKLSVAADSHLGAVPNAAVADAIKLSGGTLLATDSFTLNANRGVELAGGASGTFEVASDKTLSVDGLVSGLGDLNKTGAGRLNLLQGNSFVGGSTIAGGTLGVGHNNALSIGSVALANGTSLSFAPGVSAFGNDMVINGTVTLALDSPSAGDLGPRLDGVMSGGGALSVNATNGRIVVANNNTFTGGTTVVGGELYVGDAGTLGNLGTGAIVNNGSLVFNRSDDVTWSQVIGGSGSVTKLQSNTLTWTANNTYTGSTTISAGTLKIGAGGTVGALGSGAVVINGALVFNRSDDLSIGLAFSGSGSLTKMGSNTLTLTENATYTGATHIAGGRLVLANAAPTTSTSGFTGTGVLRIEPTGDDFTGAFSTAGWNFGSGLTGLTIGKASGADGTSDQDITLASAIEIAGPVTVFGKQINVDGLINTTAAGNAGNVSLTASGNMVFDAAVTAYNLTLVSGGKITMANTTVSNDWLVTTRGAGANGGVVQLANTALNITGAATLTADTGTNQVASLDNAGNNFGGVLSFVTANSGSWADVSVVDSDGGLTLGNVALLGDLNVTSTGGAITQAQDSTIEIDGTATLNASALGVDADGNPVTVAANITLDGDNNFAGTVNATGDSITLVDSVGDLTLGNVTASGNLDVTAATNVTLSGTVSAQSLDIEATAGQISQAGDSTLTVTQGEANLVAANDITLDGDNNFAGTVNATGDSITLVDSVGDLTLGNVTASGNLDVTAATNVTLSGTVSAQSLDIEATAGQISQAGDSTLTVTQGEANLVAANDITLASATNNFGGTVNAEGASIALADSSGGLTLGNIDASGSFVATSTGGAITQAQDSTIEIDGTATLNASAPGVDADGNPVTVAANITLASATNDFGGTVNATGSSITLVDATGGLELGNVSATGSFDAVSADGAITQAANANLSVGGDLTIGNQQNRSDILIETDVSILGSIRVFGLDVQLNQSLTAGENKDIIVSATENFKNNAGANALNVSGSGRWIVYAGTARGNIYGDLNSGNTAVWNANIDTLAPDQVPTGNRYVFDQDPIRSVVVTTTNDSKIYGESIDVSGNLILKSPGITAESGAYLGVDDFRTFDVNDVFVTGPVITSTKSQANALVGTAEIVATTLGSQSAAQQQVFDVSYENTGVLTVNRRAVTFEAVAAEKTYGDANPVGGYEVVLTAGSIATNIGDTDLDVTGTITRQAGENAGAYDILLGTGAKAANYDITFIEDNNAFTINRAILTLTGFKVYDGSLNIAHTDLTVVGVKVYGEAEAEKFEVSGFGTMASKHVQTTQQLASVAGLTLTGVGGANLSNYVALAPAQTSVTVTPLAITLTAPDAVKTYDANRLYDVTLADLDSLSARLVGGDRVSTAEVRFDTKDAGSGKTVEINSFVINDGNAGNNYTVSLATSTAGTINKAPLTIRAVDDADFVTQADLRSNEVDMRNNYAGVIYNGFVGGETAAVLTGGAVTRSNTSLEDAGTYTNVLNPVGFSSNNYEIIPIPGTYRIVGADELLVRVNPTITTYSVTPSYTMTAQYVFFTDPKNRRIQK